MSHTPTLPRPVPRALVHLLLAFAVVATSFVATAPVASAATMVDRVSGSNRIETAVEVAHRGWTSAPRVLLATSQDYPDAVAAAAYAAALQAPLLLTDPETLSGAVGDALGSLQTTQVTILGGPRAVTPTVAQQLESLGMQVDRVAGSSRWQTAGLLGDEVARRGPVEVVAIALGDRLDGRDAWPDALAAASLAALERPVPTLLTRRTFLPSDTARALERLNPAKVLLLGGEGAIGAEVEATIRDRGYAVERLDGDNRYDTAVAVAQAAMAGPDNRHGELDPDRAIFVSGQGFADALGAGALAARLDAPLLLVPGGTVGDEVDAFLRSAQTDFAAGVVVGGPSVVTTFVEDEIQAALTGEPRPDPPPACDPAHSSPDCQYSYRHPVKTWEDLAECESHGNWQSNTGNGYYGGLQFHIDTWRSVGGAGYPHENSKWEQIHRGEILQERSGWGQWPHCSRELGLR